MLFFSFVIYNIILILCVINGLIDEKSDSCVFSRVDTFEFPASFNLFFIFLSNCLDTFLSSFNNLNVLRHDFIRLHFELDIQKTGTDDKE
jgi:hypothetical protein